MYRTGAEEVSLVEPAYRTDLSRPAIASRDSSVTLGTIIGFYVKIFFCFASTNIYLGFNMSTLCSRM